MQEPFEINTNNRKRFLCNLRLSYRTFLPHYTKKGDNKDITPATTRDTSHYD